MILLEAYSLAAFLSFIIVLLGTPFFIRLANAKGWVVKPRSDRWHTRTTALMGGVVIFIGFSIAFFLFMPVVEYAYVYAATLVLFITGLADDLRELKPAVKLIAQVVCAFALIFNGYYFGGGLLEWAGIPLTFFWIIGITNALNLLDNMDGLAAGIATITAIIAGVISLLNNNLQLACLAFTVAGSAAGFLVYNFNPARIFMGDSGSLFLGFSIAFLSIAIQKNMGSSSSILVMLIPIGLMAIPIMDTTLVTIKRIFAGRRIDQGGKDHTSHRLVALGLTERKAVLLLYGISIVWGIVCILMYNASINHLLLIVFLVAVFSVVFALLLSKVKVYNESEEKLIYLRSRGYEIGKGNNLFFRLLLMNKKLIAGVFADILIIALSFHVALDATNTSRTFTYAMPAVFICVSISFFYLSNMYYRMWRYMAVMELGGYFLSALGSLGVIALILYLTKKLNQFSPYFLLVYFLLCFTGVIVSRLMFRWIIEFVYGSRQAKKKVLIYGAGDSGFLLIKELLQNRKYDFTPAGWIDDDEAKHKMMVYGLKIWGSSANIAAICKKHDISAIIISSKAITPEKEAELKTELDSLQVEVLRFQLELK
jgi:UDP-GlcNAc:undecaprenyl-phosphate GlcNAc-1-phosphate transferase